MRPFQSVERYRFLSATFAPGPSALRKNKSWYQSWSLPSRGRDLICSSAKLTAVISLTVPN